MCKIAIKLFYIHNKKGNKTYLLIIEKNKLVNALRINNAVKRRCNFCNCYFQINNEIMPIKMQLTGI